MIKRHCLIEIASVGFGRNCFDLSQVITDDDDDQDNLMIWKDDFIIIFGAHSCMHRDNCIQIVCMLNGNRDSNEP